MKYIALLILFTSCSLYRSIKTTSEKPSEFELKGYNEYIAKDYIDHVMSFEGIYKESVKKKMIPQSKSSRAYLRSIVENIVSTNELFFSQNIKSKFYIVDSDIVFHFSLPGRKIFLSSSLLAKYIKNESMLYCLIIFELIRSEKNIYKKTIIIPTGTIDTNRMLSLLRLRSSEKIEIHKWAYYLLRRAGIDTDTYLSWLQVQNRNSLDFATQLGDIQSISREEAIFKAFLIESEKEGKNILRRAHEGSSKRFYSFIGKLKGKA